MHVFNGESRVAGMEAQNIMLYVTKRKEKEKEKKTNKHESDDMVVNYDFIICHDTQIYYDNMSFFSSS